MAERFLVKCDICGTGYFKDKKGKKNPSKDICPKCIKLGKKIKFDSIIGNDLIGRG